MKALLLSALLAWAPLPLAAQELIVRHVDGREVRLTAAELAALPDTQFAVLDHGRETRFRGVPLRALLADLDAALGGKQAFVVTHENGAPLAPAHGPYRAVLVGDARAARWVRQLVRLELIELP